MLCRSVHRVGLAVFGSKTFPPFVEKKVPDGFTATSNYHTESSGTHHNMSNDLTEDVIQEYQEAFQLFDKDGNGHIEAKGNTQPQPIVFHRSCG